MQLDAATEGRIVKFDCLVLGDVNYIVFNVSVADDSLAVATQAGGEGKQIELGSGSPVDEMRDSG